MVDFTDGMDFTGRSPEELLLIKIKDKLTNLEDGYPSKYFMQWCSQIGGLHLFLFRGEDPRIGFPERDQTPALLVMPTESDAIEEPYGRLASHEDFLTLSFEGFLYTDDVDQILRFAWLFKAAISKPYIGKGTFDKLYGPTGVPDLISYWPSGPTDFTPWGKEQEAPEVYSFSIPITFRFSTNLFK